MPEDATDKSVTWTSSDTNVATVDSNGTITAVANGTTTITVKTNDGGYTATCEVTVLINVTKVKLNKTSTTLTVGGTETLTATVLPEDAIDKSVTWTSSNPSVATVDTEGNVTAKVDGTTTITATSVINPNAKATCKVTVNDTCTVITANKDSTLTLNNTGENNPFLLYSTDRSYWSVYSAPINITQGDRLYLKGTNRNGWSHSPENYSTLSITGDASISGNVMGLLDNGAKPGEQGNITAIPCANCFRYLFYCSQITSISEDFLPATSLAMDCYYAMFQCCPLTNAPALPATSLAVTCYLAMFLNCESLTTAPDLPATTLADHCYQWMFKGCTSLTTVPNLPAVTLAYNCYRQMFDGCTSLNSIKIGYTGNYDSSYFIEWVSGVASSGTFYYNGSDSLANFGFPSGWTIEHWV